MRRDIGSLSLSERAYTEIRASILSGRLPLGSPISRRRLAQELSMSVVPVSDALQRLETEGLVESWPRVGTRVRIPTVQDVRGHYVIREALESQSARLFSQKASPEEREEILQLAERLDHRYQLYGAGQLSIDEAYQLHEQHFRFHVRIAECSGYRALCQAIEQNQILTFNWLYDTVANRRSLPADHHSSLAKVLSQTNPNEADAAMRTHVMYGCEEMLRKFEEMTAPRFMSSRSIRDFDPASRDAQSGK